jgi:hypothetical protein
MRVAVLGVASLIVLALVGSDSAVARVDGLLAPAGIVAKAPLDQNIKKQVTGPAKGSPKASPNLERASGLDRDNPLLGLLWLLTGSAKRQ